MKQTKYLLLMTAFLIGAALSPAGAHKGTDHRLKISVRSDQIHCEAHLEASQLTEAFDENGDHSLSVAEFSNNAAEIKAWIDERLQLIADNGLPIKASFADSPIENFETLSAEDSIHHIRVIRRFDVPSEDGKLWLLYNFFETENQNKNYELWQESGLTWGTLRKDTALLRIK